VPIHQVSREARWESRERTVVGFHFESHLSGLREGDGDFCSDSGELRKRPGVGQERESDPLLFVSGAYQILPEQLS